MRYSTLAGASGQARGPRTNAATISWELFCFVSIDRLRPNLIYPFYGDCKTQHVNTITDDLRFLGVKPRQVKPRHKRVAASLDRHFGQTFLTTTQIRNALPGRSVGAQNADSNPQMHVKDSCWDASKLKETKADRGPSGYMRRRAMDR